MLNRRNSLYKNICFFKCDMEMNLYFYVRVENVYNRKTALNAAFHYCVFARVRVRTEKLIFLEFFLPK